MEWIVSFAGHHSDLDRIVALGSTDRITVRRADRDLEVVVQIDEKIAYDDDDFAWVLKHGAEQFVGRRLSVLRLVHGYEVGNLFGDPKVRSIRESGDAFEFIFLSPPLASMPWEMYEKQYATEVGEPPTRPSAIDDVAQLDPVAVLDLADEFSIVERGLHLLSLALADREGLDWAAAYSAIEVVEEFGRVSGVDGSKVGWWDAAEMTAFKATANSPTVLGSKARHAKLLTKAGKEMRTPAVTLDEQRASWFVRGVYARWLRSLDKYEPGRA